MRQIIINGRYETGDMLVGMLDAMIALGVSLANAGLVTREQIAAAMTELGEQQQAADGCSRPGRKVAADALRQFFSAPVLGDPARRFTVVDGGKGDDEPPPAA